MSFWNLFCHKSILLLTFLTLCFANIEPIKRIKKCLSFAYIHLKYSVFYLFLKNSKPGRGFRRTVTILKAPKNYILLKSPSDPPLKKDNWTRVNNCYRLSIILEKYSWKPLSIHRIEFFDRVLPYKCSTNAVSVLWYRPPHHILVIPN